LEGVILLSDLLAYLKVVLGIPSPNSAELLLLFVKTSKNQQETHILLPSSSVGSLVYGSLVWD